MISEPEQSNDIVADRQLSLLLEAIEKESVPQRLLDLALQLQKALTDRHAGIENADHPV